MTLLGALLSLAPARSTARPRHLPRRPARRRPDQRSAESSCSASAASSISPAASCSRADVQPDHRPRSAGDRITGRRCRTAVLPFAAVLFAWIGFFNVGASTGHWTITDWFLHFAMRSAVRTYALAVDEPDRLPVDAIAGGRPFRARLRRLPRRPGGTAFARRAEHAAAAAGPRPFGSRMAGRRAVPHRQARRTLHRHARLADPDARRRGLGDGRLPARAA